MYEKIFLPGLLGKEGDLPYKNALSGRYIVKFGPLREPIRMLLFIIDQFAM